MVLPSLAFQETLFLGEYRSAQMSESRRQPLSWWRASFAPIRLFPSNRWQMGVTAPFPWKIKNLKGRLQNSSRQPSRHHFGNLMQGDRLSCCSQASQCMRACRRVWAVLKCAQACVSVSGARAQQPPPLFLGIGGSISSFPSKGQTIRHANRGWTHAPTSIGLAGAFFCWHSSFSFFFYSLLLPRLPSFHPNPRSPPCFDRINAERELCKVAALNLNPDIRLNYLSHHNEISMHHAHTHTQTHSLQQWITSPFASSLQTAVFLSLFQNLSCLKSTSFSPVSLQDKSDVPRFVSR